MAGTSSNFDAAAFRSAIQGVMTMGLSNVSSELPTFIFPTTYSYPPGTTLDEQGKPYDLTILPLATPKASVQATCAIEWAAGTDTDMKIEPIGDIQETDIVLTMLDVDYATVRGAAWVQIGKSKYEIHYIEPPLGLFDVTVYRLHAKTVDEQNG
jgi:hypothetical protein